MSIGILPACMCEGFRSPGIGATDRYELPCGCLELNPSPLEKQLVLFTTEPSPQPLKSSSREQNKLRPKINSKWFKGQEENVIQCLYDFDTEKDTPPLSLSLSLPPSSLSPSLRLIIFRLQLFLSFPPRPLRPLPPFPFRKGQSSPGYQPNMASH